MPRDFDYKFVTRYEDLAAIAREIERADVIGLDIETTSFEPYDIDRRGLPAEIRLIQLNTGQGIYVIDLFQTGEPKPILDALRRQDTICVIQNAKFEQHWFLYKYDIELWPIFDTFRASVLIHNGKDMEHHLWALFERELGVTPMAEDLGGSDWSKPNLSQTQKDYAAEDVVYLLRLRDKLKSQLFEWGLQQTALIEFGAVLPETAVELNGIPFDSDHWMSLARRAVNEADKLRKDLVWKMPNPKQQLGLPGITPGINLDSNSQLLSSLRKLGGPIQHLENTTEMSLSLFAADYPIIEEILKYRGFQKKSTQFGSKFLTNLHEVTGRIHSSYYPFTGAGRYANSKPNLQQIPRDLAYRQTFRAPNGKRIVVADYSNIEMRICAEVTQDTKLIQIFNSADDDAHRATAAMMAGIPKEKVAKTQRQEAKAINFGLIYGMGAPKLVLYAMANYGVTMSLGRARDVRNKFLGEEGYAKVAQWHEDTMRYQRPKGMTRTLSGRLRYLGEDAYNEFLNTPIQGTGADGLKASLREVYFRMKKYGGWRGQAKMIHHVHDEIVLEVEDDPEMDRLAKQELCEGMQAGMERFVKSVPVKVEPESGESWGDAK